MTRKGVLPGPWHYAMQVKITGKESGPKTHTESSLMGRRRHYSQFKAILWVGVIQMSSWGGWPSLEAESTCHKQIQNVLVLNGEYQRLHLLPPSFMILWHRCSKAFQQPGILAKELVSYQWEETMDHSGCIYYCNRAKADYRKGNQDHIHQELHIYSQTQT